MSAPIGYEALAQLAQELQDEAPDIDSHPWPEGSPADERSDPLFDSCRDYVEQVGVYKRFQGKSTEDRRAAANKARAKARPAEDEGAGE